MSERARLTDVAAPVRVPKTAELVASHLRRQIVRGELKEGDALPPESARSWSTSACHDRPCGRRSGSSNRRR